MPENDPDALARVLDELQAIRQRVEELEQSERELDTAYRALRESERKYQDLYDHAPDMFFSVDVPSGRIIECNHALALALGCRKRDVLGRHVRRIFAPESQEALAEATEKFLNTGEVSAELLLRRGDGSTCDVSLKASAVRDGRGALLSSRGVLRDVSARKREEAARRASEERFRVLTENAYDLVSELDAEGRFTWVGPSVERTLGWRAEELCGTQALERVHPDDLAQARERLARVAAGGQLERQESRYLHRDGHWVWLETVAGLYHDRRGVPRVLSVSRDVTERRRHLQEREAVVREKEKALAHVRALSGLLPICTHCRKVRDDAGYWRNLEAYVSAHSNAVFSHSLCEACLKKHYADVVEDR